MTIPAFGWHDNSPPNISAANLEAMHLAGGAYTDQKTGYFSVKDPTFGAKGDGTTDDTAAIQTAINQAAANSSRGGAVVYLPSGTYLISSALLVYFGVHLICASSLSTTIRASATAPLSNFQNGNNAPGGGGPRPDYTGTHVVPALIRWDGNDKWAHGVRITGVTLDTNGIPGLSGMWIEDTGEGSWFDDVSCSSCVATNRTVSNGQLVAGSNNVTLTHVPTLVSSGTASGGSTQAATLNTTGATLLVVTIGTVTNPPTVSDSLGNAWTVIGGNATFMAYAWQKSGGGALVTGATHTITVTSSVGSVWFGAYSNTQTAADPLDASYESYTGGSGVSPQAVTPTQGYDFAVTMFGSSDGPFTTVSVDSGFNIVYTSDWISGTHYSNATATKIATDTSPIKPTWTPSTTADFSIATAVFKAAPVSDTFTEEDVNAILSFGGSVPAPASPTLTAHYQLSPPGAPVPTTATTGGTVAAGIYTVATTFVNVLGETVASAQGTITTTGATSTITVPFPASPPADATGWYAYVSQAGGSTLTRQQAAGSPTGVATNFVLTAPPTSTGAAPPVTNTTGGSLTSGTTYTVGLTYLTANGETAISVATPPAPPQPSITPSGTNPYITVTTPGAPAGGGATGWFAYVTHDGNLPLQRSQAPGSATAVGTNYQLTSYPASGAATPYQKIDRIDWAANSHDAQHSTAIMRGPAAATLSNISFTVARPTDAFVIQNIGTPGNVGQLHGVTNSGALLRTRGGSGDIKQLSGDDNVGGMFRWSGGAWGADMALINIHSIKAESDTYNANWQYSMDPVILLDRCFTVALNVYGGTYLGGAYVRDVVRLDNNFTSTLAPSPSVLLVGVEGQNWYNPQYANIIHDSSTGGAIASSDYSSSPAYPVILWNRKLKLGGGARIQNVPAVFNVKDYGAMGDGSTVDTTAVQNCVNAALAAGGGVVWFPAGTYIMAMVTFGSNIIARGAGMGATVLKMDPAVYTNTTLYGSPSTALVARIAPASSSTSTSNFKMEDLTIDGNMSVWGNSTTNRMMGFYLGQGTAGLISHSKMRDVEIRACMSYAFDIENVTDVDLESCWAHDNGYTTGTGTHIACDGFTFIGSDITAVNCRSYTNSNNGYLCGQNAFTWYRVKLLGCHGSGNNNHGATLGSDATGALHDSQVVGGSYVSNTTGSGVQLSTNAIGCTVTGVTATGNGQDGIRVSAASYNAVTGNTLQNNAAASSANPEIYLLSSALRNSVVSNVINSTTATHAIQEQNNTTDYNTITNNMVTSTSGTILPAGLHTQVRGNVGYNPVGAVTVTVPASGTAVAAVQYDRTFYVTASTSTVTMAISPGPSPIIPANGFAAIRVPATATVTPTYTVAPTWVVEGD